MTDRISRPDFDARMQGMGYKPFHEDIVEDDGSEATVLYWMKGCWRGCALQEFRMDPATYDDEVLALHWALVVVTDCGHVAWSPEGPAR